MSFLGRSLNVPCLSREENHGSCLLECCDGEAKLVAGSRWEAVGHDFMVWYGMVLTVLIPCPVRVR
jgi:hypothetical protein